MEEVVDLLVVDLQEGAEDADVGEFLRLLEDLVDGSRNDSSIATVVLDLIHRVLFLGLVALSEHGMRLA